MASKREAKQQKKREKHKQKREQARKRRREVVSSGGIADTGDALRWPLGSAWISTNWPERGAYVYAAISRRRADGNLAASFFEVDLAERGLVAARATAGLSDDRVLGEVVRHAGETEMVEIDPVIAAKVVWEGLRFGEAQGHAVPRGADKALALIEDIDVDAFKEPILTGRERPPEPTPGRWGAVKRWLFGGPRPAAPASDYAPVGPDEDADAEDAPTDRVDRAAGE